MKRFYKKSTLRFFSERRILKIIGILPIILCLFTSCNFHWYGNFAENIKQTSETSIFFYKELPSEDTPYFQKSYRVGLKLQASQLPSAESENVKKLKPGYDLLGWNYYENSKEGQHLPSVSVDKSGVISEVTIPLDSFAVYGSWVASEDTPYTVEHWIQNVDDDEYTLYDTLHFTGRTDSFVEPEAIDMYGFTKFSSTPGYISGTGDSVFTVKYNRNIYTYEYKFTEEDEEPAYVESFGGLCHSGKFTGRYGMKLPDVLPQRYGMKIKGWNLYIDGVYSEFIEQLPDTLESDSTFVAVWIDDTSSVDFIFSFDYSKFEYVITPDVLNSAEQRNEVTISIRYDDELVKMKAKNWAVKIYDSNLGLTSVQISKPEVSESISFVIDNEADIWEEGIYYVYVTAEPVIVINGSEYTLSPVGEYVILRI